MDKDRWATYEVLTDKRKKINKTEYEATVFCSSDFNECSARVEISGQIPVLPLWLISGWRILASKQNQTSGGTGDGLVIRRPSRLMRIVIMVRDLASSPVSP